MCAARVLARQHWAGMLDLFGVSGQMYHLEEWRLGRVEVVDLLAGATTIVCGERAVTAP